MRRYTALITVIGSRRGMRFAFGYSFIDRLGVSRDISRGNIYLAMIDLASSACAIATVGRALSHSGLNLLRIKSRIGIRHDVVVGNQLSNRVIRKRISRATAYVSVGSTRKDCCFAFQCTFSGRVTGHNCVAMSGNSMAIGNIDLAIYGPASSAFRITVVPCAFRRAGFRTFGINDIIGLRFSVVNGCVDHVVRCGWNGNAVSSFLRLITSHRDSHTCSVAHTIRPRGCQ